MKIDRKVPTEVELGSVKAGDVVQWGSCLYLKDQNGRLINLADGFAIQRDPTTPVALVHGRFVVES